MKYVMVLAKKENETRTCGAIYYGVRVQTALNLYKTEFPEVTSGKWNISATLEDDKS